MRLSSRYMRSVSYTHLVVYKRQVWTDGGYPNGIPMGVLLQLDPDLDLTQFHLTEYELSLIHISFGRMTPL